MHRAQREKIDKRERRRTLQQKINALLLQQQGPSMPLKRHVVIFANSHSATLHLKHTITPSWKTHWVRAVSDSAIGTSCIEAQICMTACL